MKRRRMILAVLVMMVGAVWALEAQGRGAQWALLGSRIVTDRADHDRMKVSAEGTFTAVKVEVRRHAVDFQRMVIHFGNGADQKVELRNTIPANGESRVIDINGANRVIQSIEFWYDAKTLGKGGRAVVRVMGRR